jgi:hypothetical protein
VYSMKFASFTSVTLALCLGSDLSSDRAA